MGRVHVVHLDDTSGTSEAVLSCVS
ncbi:MAG: hypothetical protein JWR62_3305, partial [Modestobacter sp.]|nr:hypothetical protein [Modestobacter sp.]